jgi:CRISPR/Cas system-associated exonuclease Cas4 (RecB family)
MEIKEEYLRDYMMCPLMYNLKHILGMKDKDNHYDHFNKSLVQTIQQFYYEILNSNTVISADNLKSKWEKNFCNQKNIINPQEYMLRPIYGSVIDTRNRVRSYDLDVRTYTTDGWGMLHTFYRNNRDNPGYPLLINQQYTLPIGEHFLTGKINLARTTDDDKVQLIIIDSRKHSPTPFELANDLGTTLQYHAFLRMFSIQDAEILYYFIRRNEFIPVTRNQRDIDRALAIVSNIMRSIEQGIYFPRQTGYCSGCKLHDICTQWDGK